MGGGPPDRRRPADAEGFYFLHHIHQGKVRLCTHEAMADLNTVTTEPCFHLRSCSIFQLLGKKREEEKLPSMFQMNKRLLCAFLPAVSVIVGAECSRIG